MAGIAVLLGDPAQLETLQEIGESEGCSFSFVRCCSDAELPTEIEAAASQKIDVIIGSEAALKLSAMRGILCLAWHGGEENARTLLREAMTLCALVSRQQSAESELESALRAAFSGMIRVDDEGRVLYANSQAKKLLDFREETMAGHYLPNLFSSMDKIFLDEAITNGEPVHSILTGTRTRRLLLNIDPVLNGDRIDGAMVALRSTDPKAYTGQTMGRGRDAEINRRFDNCCYSSKDFSAVVQRAMHVAFLSASILIYGEEGTETLELARFIHNRSNRHAAAFVELECGVLEERVLEELLFSGTEHSWLNGQRLDGGTLFLNHLEKLSMGNQFLINRLIRGQPIGSGETPPDVRVIAAMSQDLRQMVKSGDFREDLYYVLNVITLQIPPLRERWGNIDDYVELFLGKYSDQFARNVILDSGARSVLRAYNWPGNVVELENLCERLVLSAKHWRIGKDLVRRLLEQGSVLGEERLQHWKTEAETITDALRSVNGSRTFAAAKLGMSRTTLWRKMQKYNISNNFRYEGDD